MRFHLRQYDSEAVVFDTASGDTHYLAPLALALFQFCRASPPPSREAVARLLAERHLIEPGWSADAQIEDTLEELVRIGLISPT